MTDLRTEQDIGIGRQPPEKRSEVQGVADAFEQPFPAPLPRLPAGILRREPCQQSFAVGRRAAVVFVRLHGDLLRPVPHQPERMQQPVQRLRKRIGTHPEGGIGDPHRVGVETLADDTHAEALPGLPQDLAERLRETVFKGGLRGGGCRHKTAHHI